LVDKKGYPLEWEEVIPDNFLLAVQLQVVLFSTALSFMVVQSSLAKGSIDKQTNRQVYNSENRTRITFNN